MPGKLVIWLNNKRSSKLELLLNNVSPFFRKKTDNFLEKQKFCILKLKFIFKTFLI